MAGEIQNHFFLQTRVKNNLGKSTYIRDAKFDENIS